MGGSAFSAVLQLTAFPRIPPVVYRNLKARFHSKLAELYTWVGVPIEAPEKVDHGDIDFVVAIPKDQADQLLPHQVIKEILGAELVIPMEGNRTSNYAVPIPPGDWAQFGHSTEEDDKRKMAVDEQIFYQVSWNKHLILFPPQPKLNYTSRLMFTSAWAKMNGIESCSSILTAILA